MIAAYREPDRKRGRELMQQLIGAISHSVPTALREVITLGRTLKRRAVDVLAYFDRPGTSNGPTEAINGRLEHLRGSTLGFRNLTNYIARSLLETGGFRPDYTLDHEEPLNPNKEGADPDLARGAFAFTPSAVQMRVDSMDACAAWPCTASNAIPASRSWVRQVCRNS
jgi:hypothetical protein